MSGTVIVFLPHVLLVLLGLAVGALVSWLWMRNRDAVARAASGELRRQNEDLAAQLQQLRARLDEQLQARVQAETNLQQQERNLAEQRRLLQEAERKLADTFKALAAGARLGCPVSSGRILLQRGPGL